MCVKERWKSINNDIVIQSQNCEWYKNYITKDTRKRYTYILYGSAATIRFWCDFWCFQDWTPFGKPCRYIPAHLRACSKDNDIRLKAIHIYVSFAIGTFSWQTLKLQHKLFPSVVLYVVPHARMTNVHLPPVCLNKCSLQLIKIIL